MEPEQLLNAQRGSYALLLRLERTQWIKVGKLGNFKFPKGYHIYLGSAMGNGGIYSRVSWHINLHKKEHWHIDWLRSRCQLVSILYSIIARKLECIWSRALLKVSGSEVVAPGFGASDCINHCVTHLVSFRDVLPKKEIFNAIEMVSSNTIYELNGYQIMKIQNKVKSTAE